MGDSRQLIQEVLVNWRSCDDVAPKGNSKRGRGSRRTSGAGAQSSLARTIETEVIPRLMLAHRTTTRPAEEKAITRKAEPEDVAELARLVLAHDGTVATEFVETLRRQGLPYDVIYMQLIAPTARLLGEMWKADLCDFTDVTIGLSRLQQLLHLLSPAFDNGDMQSNGHRILLASVPGEQHTLGILLVEEYFRRAGWSCECCFPESVGELRQRVADEHFDVVGLSASYRLLLDGMASAIQVMRRASCNRTLMVLVGGMMFLEDPGLVRKVGADGTAEDGRQAVAQLQAFLGRSLSRG